MRLGKGVLGQLVLVSLVVLSACASPQSAPDRAASGSSDTRPQGLQAPKVLVWAVQNEPGNVTSLSGLGGTRGPSAQFRILAHARMATDDYTLAPQPDLALELPSVEKGTWKLNADGTMETTWKLRPNVKWHDGTPFTSADVAFWFTVIKDDKIPGGASLIGLDQVTGVTTPDASTVVIHWSAPFFQANEVPDVGPLPKHLLEVAYTQSDAETFLNHRYFTTEFVGLGPYKLGSWTPGSQIDFERFDGYFGQRPAIDKIVVRIIPDFNTMVSNILASSVDIANPPAENMEVALELKQRWEGTGDRVRTDPNDKMRVVYMQFRPDHSRPVNGLTQRAVRQALYHAIDRQAMAQVVTGGLSPVADSWFAPNVPERKDVEASIPQYPFDLSRAQALMAQAGWVRGGDGVLTNQANGEKFELEVRNRPGSATEREIVLVNDFWKAIGVAGSVVPGTPSLVNDRTWLALFPGVQVSRLEAADAYNTRRTHSRAIASEANRWAGRNTFGYSNPTADALQERLVVTIDPQQQLALQRQLLQEMMTDVGVMPLYWDVELVLARRAVKGEVTAVETGWNVTRWDKE